MLDHSRIIIGVAGHIGSGKTIVAQELASSFSFGYLRYSLVLAEWFGANPEDKGRLQEIGGRVMSGEGQRELNRRLIDQILPDKDTVIDGLRHPLDFASLDSQFHQRFSLIFIETPADVRFSRLRERFSNFNQFEDADRQPVESKIDDLKPLASATLPGTLKKAELQTKLTSLIGEFRQKAEA